MCVFHFSAVQALFWSPLMTKRRIGRFVAAAKIMADADKFNPRPFLRQKKIPSARVIKSNPAVLVDAPLCARFRILSQKPWLKSSGRIFKICQITRFRFNEIVESITLIDAAQHCCSCFHCTIAIFQTISKFQRRQSASTANIRPNRFFRFSQSNHFDRRNKNFPFLFPHSTTETARATPASSQQSAQKKHASAH